jgi:phasin
MMASSPKKAAAAPAAAIPPLTEANPGNISEAAAAVAEPVGEIQQNVRAAVEKGITESRAAFAKAKASADDAANAFELSFSAARDGALAINAKALEALRTNTEANFDFVKASLAVKSASDLFALQSEFARKQIEVLTGQVKDIAALTQKTVAEAVEPLKEQIAKSLKAAA